MMVVVIHGAYVLLRPWVGRVFTPHFVTMTVSTTSGWRFITACVVLFLYLLQMVCLRCVALLDVSPLTCP